MNPVVAIIPARGGSKGIPRKNLCLVGGKPLVAHSIAHALNAPSVDRVFVSTDDDEIAEVSVRHGAEVIRRPEEISGDTASSESALAHALDHLARTENCRPDLVVFLQATSPLRRAEDVENAVLTLRRENADSLFSASPSHGFVWRMGANGPESFTYDHRSRPRRQDAPEDVVENGSIYVFKPWVLERENNRLGGRIATYRMPTRYSYQIDDPEDIELLNALMQPASGAPPAELLCAAQMVVFDFDGVMTDNRVLVDQTGREAVLCHRGDGWGIARLKDAGWPVYVLSTEKNPVVEARCRKLGIEYIQGCDDKASALAELAASRNLTAREVIFAGNDDNDLGCLQWAGVPIVVADASARARATTPWRTTANGGYGAVREIAEWLLAARKQNLTRSTHS